MEHQHCGICTGCVNCWQEAGKERCSGYRSCCLSRKAGDKKISTFILLEIFPSVLCVDNLNIKFLEMFK